VVAGDHPVLQSGKTRGMADVRLVDLEVIKRYSLALRQDTAPAEEVLAALDASRAAVRAAMGKRRAPLKAR
jgi:hypothetical protein